MPLTDTACKNAKPKDKPYKKFDSGGLYLHVKPNGSKLWRLDQMVYKLYDLTPEEIELIENNE